MKISELNVITGENVVRDMTAEEVTEWEASNPVLTYVENRLLEYPTLAELTVALYDTDDKAALETKRAAIKTKWPKDNSGPIE
jgi:hypothetical protein